MIEVIFEKRDQYWFKPLTHVAFEEAPISSMDAIFGDLGDRTVCNVAVRQRKGLQVSWAGGDSPTAQLPLWNQDIAQSLVVPQFLCHLLRSQPHPLLIFLAPQEDAERLIRTGDYALPVLQMVFRVVESFAFLVSVLWIWIRVVPAKVLGRWRSVVNPRRPADKILHHGARQPSHLWDYLDAGRAISNDCDPLVGVVIIVIPECRMCDMALEVT